MNQGFVGWSVGATVIRVKRIVVGIDVPAPVPSITFDLPQAGTSAEIVWQARGDTAAANVQLEMQFNGDTGANYDAVRYDNSAGANDANNGSFGATSGYCGYASAASDAAGVAGSGQILLPEYANPTWQRTWEALSFSGGTSPATSAASFLNILMGKWRNTTSPITTVTLFPLSGNFVAGSVFTLYVR